MGFNILVSTLFFFLFSLIRADSQEFGLKLRDDGASYNNDVIYVSSNVLTISTSNDASAGNLFSGVVTDLGYIKLADGSYIYIDDDKNLKTTTDVAQATTDFSIRNGFLAYRSESAFNVLISSDGALAFKVGYNDSRDSRPILAQCTDKDGNSVPAFEPNSASVQAIISTATNSAVHPGLYVSASSSAPAASTSVTSSDADQSETFGLITIKSASRFHLLSVSIDTSDNKVFAATSNSFTSTQSYFEGVVTKDSTVKLTNGSYLFVDSDSTLKITSDSSKATKGFSISQGGLALAQNQFYILSSDAGYLIRAGNTTDSDANYIRLRTADKTGQVIPDYTPAYNQASTLGPVSTTASASHQATSQPTISTTTSASHQSTVQPTISTSTTSSYTPMVNSNENAGVIVKAGSGFVTALFALLFL